MAEGLDSPQPAASSTEERVSMPLAAAAAIFGGGDPRPASPHSRRFRALTAMLVGVAIVALVVVIVALGSTGAGSGAKWSSWKPPDTGNQGAQDIADHIAPFYRVSATDQLDVITVMNLASPSAVSSTSSSSTAATGGLEVAVKPNTFSSQISLLSGNTVAYNLCGIGSNNCTIGIGTPSSDRLLLLRREALELALYTFKYIGGTNNVVAVLPPGRATVTSTLTAKPPATTSTKSPLLDTAVLFVKSELSPWLSQPLSSTLQEFPPAVPQLALWHQTTEAGLVDQITARGLFSEKLVNAQDGSNLIVLDPLPPQ